MKAKKLLVANATKEDWNCHCLLMTPRIKKDEDSKDNTKLATLQTDTRDGKWRTEVGLTTRQCRIEPALHT